jgi:hypothetical protein
MSSISDNSNIEIIKPVTVRISVSGRARGEDGKYKIKWFDNSVKELKSATFSYSETDFGRAINQISRLYQLNKESILKIELKTI